MRKFLVSLVIFTMAATNLLAQDNGQLVRCIAFYNLENLFDTIHDVVNGVDKNDYEYLPDGGMHWTPVKYEHKLHRMAYAVSQLGLDETSLGAACIGVAEVENIRCLEDLVKQPELADRNLQPILLEGPDRRGVDVGFLYNPRLFKPVGQPKGYTLNAHYADGGKVNSRLQLLVSGYLMDEKGGIVRDKIHIIVCHWPSRYGGEESSRATRDTAAMLTKHIVDSLYLRDPMSKVIVMGDLNDDPFNHSCAEVLNAKKRREDVEKMGIFNTMWQRLDKGVGSLAYNGSWNLFDQIMITEPLLNQELTTDKWTYWKPQIFNKEFLTTPEGKEKGTPLRTHKGGVWQDGYSDHYPTMIYLIKKN
ncbi:MAG: endonuclease/exonuclease/phosphatase family protein [Paludibacteraceae bacterium]|nr:endonuclease/exonuclease/phosphatase family protein [Paludibacteraceae bacterium]